MDRFRLWGGKVTTGVSANPFAVVLPLACLFHLLLLLILEVVFSFPRVGADRQAPRPLEILVLRQTGPSNGRPEIVDARPGARPVSAGLQRHPQPALGQGPLPAPLSLPEPARGREPQPLEPPSPESGPARIDATKILASRNREVAELAARTRRKAATFANRPRRKAVHADTREYTYANYLEAWRRKVERVGNLNYPEAARRLKLYGSLVLRIALRADGSVEQVRVLRSSGSELLDQAALGIIELAAPFAPFPPAIRAEAEILEITRTWRFLSNNRLGWER